MLLARTRVYALLTRGWLTLQQTQVPLRPGGQVLNPTPQPLVKWELKRNVSPSTGLNFPECRKLSTTRCGELGARGVGRRPDAHELSTRSVWRLSLLRGNSLWVLPSSSTRLDGATLTTALSYRLRPPRRFLVLASICLKSPRRPLM